MKYFKVAIVLSGIALVCSLVIALINMLTSPIISDNKVQTELNTCKEIFSTIDEKSVKEGLTGDQLNGYNSAIEKIIYAKDSNNNELGTIYVVTGKNAYGTISLMVAIKDKNVYKVEFLENSQSFAQTVNEHLLGNYPSSGSTDKHLGAYSSSDVSVGELNSSDVNNIDVKCGATYGATLIKDLVKIALESEVA